MEIISVDSALIYKGMDIGTSKPSISELQYAPHKLIDICDLSEDYSVANFYYDAIGEIEKITQSGRTPLLVGGTMLYFKILLQGLFYLPKSNQKIRDQLKQEAQALGWMKMYNKLKYIDPVSSRIIHYNDHKRIIRALEIFFISGRTWTELKKHCSKTLHKYRILQFAIMPSSRIILNNRIETRFYNMLNSGLEQEVSILYNQSNLYEKKKLSISCIGYRQMWEYLSGKINRDRMIYSGINATCNLAKRQLTWLRNWRDLYWLESDNISTAIENMLLILVKNSFDI